VNWIRPFAVPFALAAAAPAGAVDAPLGIPPLRIFTARETGVPTTAWSIAQDATGMMYFGCDTVVSFNGDHWQAERMGATYLVRGLDIGPDGRIWAAGVNELGWFDRGESRVLEYHSLARAPGLNGAEVGEVWRAFADGPSRAFFVARDKILHWDGQRMSLWNLPGQDILWANRTAQGVYVDYPPQGLLRLGTRGPELALPRSVLGAHQVRWVDDSEPAWLLLTPLGLERVVAGTCQAVDGPASDFVRRSIPTAAARLTDGSLVVGTLQGGLAHVDGEGRILQVIDQRCGLPANQVYALFRDREGALWATGPTYILRLGWASGASLYGERAGYPVGGADSLSQTNGSFLISSQGGLYRLETDPLLGSGRFVPLPVTSDRLYGAVPAADGLVVATLHGLARWSAGGLRPIHGIDEAAFRTQPSRAHPAEVLASLRNRVVRFDPDSGGVTVVADQLPDYGNSIADDPAGRIWVGTPSRGLLVARPGHVRAEPAGPALGPLPPAGAAYVAVSGLTVAALTPEGAFVLGAGADHFVPVAGSLRGSPAAIASAGAPGEFWAAYEADNSMPRLGRIADHGGAWAWSPVSADGLADVGSLLNLYDESIDGHEELWLAGTQALLRAPRSAFAPHPPPAPRLQLWRPRGARAAVVAAGEHIAYSEEGLYAEFGSMDFGRREPDQFETMLAGAETTWSLPDRSARRALPALREGRYTLRVRSVSEAGEEGPEAQLGFAVGPPWWRSPAANAAAVAAAVASAALLLRLRTRSLHRRAVRLEETVQRRTAELERANAAKTDFVASMSHEIRNPMGGILSSAQRLASLPLTEAHREAVTTLASCAEYLSRLVEDVLDFATIEAGAYQITVAPFNPRELLENVVTMLRPSAGTHVLSTHADEELPEALLGDAGRIQQIMVNFTANALKFGGPTVQLSVRGDDGYCLFAVADDGAGIPPAEQEFLFARFSRLKAARNSAVPGTGLGLAVSRELAERMGGEVGVVSQPGQGTLFFLKLPLRPASGPARATDPVPAGHALIIEDVAYNARALGFMLKSLGFTSDVASTGQQALQLLRTASYQAVFVDCDVPEVSGLEITRHLRRTEGGRRTLIVATTALATPENERACRRAGMDRFVAKPVTTEKLRRALAPASAAGAPPAAGVDIDLALFAPLAAGGEGARAAEAGRFQHAFEEALAGLERARSEGQRPAIASAAHRLFGLARLINATAVAETARDLQECAAVYSPDELALECATLRRRGLELLRALEARINSPGDGTAGGPSSPARRYL